MTSATKRYHELVEKQNKWLDHPGLHFLRTMVPTVIVLGGFYAAFYAAMPLMLG